MKIGVIFPGQGSEHDGMARQVFMRSRAAQELFELASECLGEDLSPTKMCFGGNSSQLDTTQTIQMGLFIASTAIYAAIQERFDFKVDIMAGHSVGEYAALYCAGALQYPDALYLVHQRARCMQAVVDTLPESGMRAIIGVAPEKVEEMCAQYDQPGSLEHVVEIACYNSSKQTVVTGTTAELSKIGDDIKNMSGMKKSIVLNVSGPFHSRLMAQAEKEFAPNLFKTDIYDPITPVVSNVNARPMTTAAGVADEMKHQITSPVRWMQSMEHFASCDLIIQVGPGSIYSTMLQKEWPDKMILNVSTISEFKELDNCLASLYMGDFIEGNRS